MRKNPVFIIFIILIILNILAWITVYDLSRPRFLEVTFFDVGQGDATFIVTPKGHQILIDGGPDSIVLEKLASEMPFWDRTIDLVILSHPHADHLKGLIDVLERYEVENILWTGVNYDSQLYQEWQRVIKGEGAEIYIAQAGQRIISSNVVLEILHPFESLEGKEARSLDNTSVGAKLIFEESSFLFTGDVHSEVEIALVNEFGEKLKSDVLKAGHHGSRTSSIREFVEQVLPEIAVISAGKDNKYGHPHREVLDTFDNYDINVLRTDQMGDIKIISDGESLKYEPR